jgi:hypothetical protein
MKMNTVVGQRVARPRYAYAAGSQALSLGPDSALGVEGGRHAAAPEQRDGGVTATLRELHEHRGQQRMRRRGRHSQRLCPHHQVSASCWASA